MIEEIYIETYLFISPNEYKIFLFDTKNFKNLSAAEKNAIERYQFIPSQEDILIREEDKQNLFEMLDIIKGKTNNENEKLCVDAVITVFERIDDLDFLNKRAIFVYLREISGLNSSELSSSLSNIRKIYRKVVGPNNMFDFYDS